MNRSARQSPPEGLAPAAVPLPNRPPNRPARARLRAGLRFGGLWLGLGLCLLIALAALIGLVWTPHDLTQMDLAGRLAPPSGAHWLGRDHFGRDILSMLMVGARVSIAVALIAVGIGAGIGLPLGLAAAAARGGWLDEALSRLSDLIFAFPALVIAILLTAVFGPSALNAMLAIGLFNIPVFARVARGAAAPLWTRDFIAAARLAGKGRLRISVEHVLPMILPMVLVQATVQFSMAVLAEAALSYVGLGVQPPQPSWGRMLAESQTMAALAPHVALFPGLAIVLAVLGLNLLGDGLRDRLDPRLAPQAAPEATPEDATPAATGADPAPSPLHSDTPHDAPHDAPPPQAPLLTLAGLGLRLQDSPPDSAPLLADLSLQIAPGEVLGLIGESGSGKSLTALALIGLLPQGIAATGTITFAGQSLLPLPEAQRRALRGRAIAMVFQEPMTALNPLMTIGDQVAEALRLHEGLPRAQALGRARAALDRCGLGPERFSLGLYPHQLSGGQRQRVAIAAAIALRPRLLICDEPTTALDVTLQAQILDLLRRLAREDGMAMLFISHDLAVVADLADRVAILRQGRLVETLPAPALRQTGPAGPRAPYTRALIAASGHQPKRRARAETGAPLLQVEQVSRHYMLPGPFLLGAGLRGVGLWARPRRLLAVDGVSFQLAAGESLGLVGESGCGKSTLARAILGLEPPSQGRILLSGQDMARPGRAQRRQLQAVFQDPYGSFNPRHRVARLLAEPLNLLDSPPQGAARAQTLRQMLQAVGLRGDEGARFIHAFSGGQRQRLALARALMIGPGLIVLDEAVSALDVSIRAQILDLLADLQARHGLAYLFISHDLQVVRAVTDRVLVMQAGQIVETGPTAQVFAKPQHDYTRRLLAATPRL